MLGFAQFLYNDGFYWIAMGVALLALSMSDNQIKASVYSYTFTHDFELVYFDI